MLNQFIIFQLQALKSGAVNPGYNWGQPALPHLDIHHVIVVNVSTAVRPLCGVTLAVLPRVEIESNA